MISIPGIGIIQRNHFSALHQFPEKKYISPYQQVHFDATSAMVIQSQMAYLSKASGKTISEIQDFFTELKDAILNTLVSDRKLEWRGMGNFHMDDDGAVSFQPKSLAIDYRPDLPYQHVIRKNVEISITVGEEEKSNAEMEAYFEEQKKSSRWRTWKMISLFIVAASMAIILYRISLGGFSVLGPAQQKITPQTPPATHLLP